MWGERAELDHQLGQLPSELRRDRTAPGPEGPPATTTGSALLLRRLMGDVRRPACRGRGPKSRGSSWAFCRVAATPPLRRAEGGGVAGAVMHASAAAATACSWRQ